MTQFYQPASGLTYTEANLQSQTGLPPTAPPGTLAANGIYTVNPTPDPYDPALYDSTAVYAIVGFYANQTWTAVPLALPVAKENGSTEMKNRASESLNVIVEASGFSPETLTSAASQVPLSRPAVYQTTLDEMTAVTDQLSDDLTAIQAATTVDEINNIVNPPTGILSTGRGGDGDGPLDLNNSFYTEFNSVSLTEAETELYVPGTSIVITYGAVVPNGFTSNGDCFITGDYRVQIREVATGMVISEFVCPLAPEHNEDIPF
jgi:hypothetical protein